MTGRPYRRYRFDEFTVDLDRACLLRAGERVSLRPKAFDVLRYLVENRGRLSTKEELIRTLWPAVIVTDDSLVKCVQDVRDALQDKQHHYIKTVPRRGYLFDATVAVESANGGVHSTPEHESANGQNLFTPLTSTEVTARSKPGADRRKLAWLVFAGLSTFAIAGVGAYYLLGGEDIADRVVPERRQATAKSVAVLPFVSISPDSGQDYFSDGISEELLNVLANIPGLHVPSRTSSFAFKGTSTDLRTIAAALNVDHVLEGSVRKSGDRVRITAQLIDVSTDSHLWSTTYDRELTNIFAIQDEIALSVAEALQIELLQNRLPAHSGLRTDNRDAHDAYLHGLHYLRTLRSEDMLKARESFLRAIELDPGYSEAYAELANSVLTAQVYGIMDRDEALAEAERAVGGALALDSQLGDAYAARGRLAAVKGDYPASDADHRRAIELRPNFARAYAGLFSALGALNRLDEAGAALEKALELDPLNASFHWSKGNVWLAQGDTDQASRAYRRAVEFEPSQPNGYSGLGDIAIMSGHLDEALASYLDGLEQDPGHVHITSIVGLIFLSLGDPERAQLWFDKAASMYPAGPLQRFFREFTPLVIRQEDPAELLAVLRGVSSGQFAGLGSRLFRKAALQTGDLDGIEGFYRRHWPELFEGEPRVGADNFDIATEVAWLSLARGEDRVAAELLDRAFEVFRDPALRSVRPPEWALVMFETERLALQGHKAEALAAFRRAIDGGWRWDWWQVESDPTLVSIRNDPGFIAMLVEVRADLTRQLEHVREMERSGEISGVPKAQADDMP